jgi:hypothetical protein
MDNPMRHNALNSELNFFIKFVRKIYTFYIDGFKGMVLGKKLWKIILIKLFIMFAILKFFFFPDFLNTNFETNEQRSDFVLEQITKDASFNSQGESH